MACLMLRPRQEPHGSMAKGKSIKSPVARNAKQTAVATDDHVSASASATPGEGNYRLLFDANPQPMWVYDRETLRFLAVNDAAIFCYGYSREEFLAMTIEQIWPIEDLEEYRAVFEQQKSEREHFGFWRHKKKNGDLIEVELTSHALDFAARDAALVLARDVTEQRLTQRRLQQKEKRLQATFAQAAVGISQVDLDGRWIRVNDRMCEIVGYSREELLQRNFVDITHPDDLASNIDFFRRAVAEKFPRMSVEKRYVRKDGSIVWVHVSGTLVREESGAPEYFVTVVEDVSLRKKTEDELQKMHEELEQRIEERTAELRGLNDALLKEVEDRRQAERDLRNSKGLLRSLIDSLQAQVAVLDPQGNVLTVNKVWMRARDEFCGAMNCSVGANYLDFCRTAFQSAEISASETVSGVQCVLDGSLAEFSFEYCADHAGERWFTLCATPLSPEGGGAVISQTEITGRHRAEMALRASHVLLRDIVEGTTDAIYVKDLQGRYTMMNSAGALALGRTPDDVIGKTARDLFDPQTARSIVREDLKVVVTGHTQTFFSTMRLMGREHDFLATKGVCRNAAGDIVGIFGISRDITERNRMSEALAHERNLLRTLIDNLPDSVFVKDNEGLFVVSNAAHRQLLRARTQQEITGKTDSDFFPPEIAARNLEEEREVLATGRALIDQTETMLDAAGQTRWFLTSKVPLLDSAGKTVGLLGVQRDITERKQTEQQLSRFASIVESSNDAIISTSNDGAILSWNKAAETIFGYSAEEMIGGTASKLSPPERRDEAAGMSDLVRQGQVFKNFETVRQTKDGRKIEIAMTVSPLRDEGGEIRGVSAIIRDISERKRLEREVLEISDNEKRRIGQDLHDDLCQYLVGVSLLANVLRDNLAAQQIKEADDARQINELVRQAVIKARSIAKGLAPLDLAGTGFVAALQELAHMVQRLFNIECIFDCASVVEIADAAVATHLYRIAQESAHNAAKHSGGKRIVICLASNADGTTLSVEDDGVGIALDHSAPASPGLGWHTMHYRARIIGAQLHFRRGAQTGTVVVCSLPAPAPARL